MRTLLMIPMMVLCLASASAQTAEKDAAKTEKEAVVLKEHVCTDACAKGEHAYVCGEKGHKCSEDCAHKHGKMKAHECTKACADGKHAYACGEKGHKCSAECMNAHKHKGHDHKGEGKDEK